MVSARVFEELIDLLEEKQGRVHTAACFRPTAERLSDIADSGQKLLQNTSDKDLTEFTE
jgi:antitoxin YafN